MKNNITSMAEYLRRRQKRAAKTSKTGNIIHVCFTPRLPPAA